MDLETIDFLLTPAGTELLRVARGLHGTFLTRVTALRKRYPAPVATAALELLELRVRAVKKFSKADEMFFTREALEQSSGESISAYHAERYAQDSRVMEIACGIGGDTIALAGRCFVTAVDSDPVKIRMAERNLEVYGLRDRVTFVCAKAADVPLEADAAFIDPSRRSEGRRSISLTEMSPSLGFLRKLVKAIPNCGVKLSPATDDSELKSLGGEIEFISDAGECKEAVVWFGAFNTATKRATILPKHDTLVDGGVGNAGVGEPSNYIYEPDPGVIRAHLVSQVAMSIGAHKMDDKIAYLTSEALVQTPFARAFEVVETLPFNLRAVNQKLRELDAGRVVIKKRGVPFEPKEIESRLKRSGKRQYVLILTLIRGRAWAFICNNAKPKTVETDTIQLDDTSS